MQTEALHKTLTVTDSTSKIFKGTTAADLAVVQPTKFELVINSAKMLR